MYHQSLSSVIAVLRYDHCTCLGHHLHQNTRKEINIEFGINFFWCAPLNKWFTHCVMYSFSNSIFPCPLNLFDSILSISLYLSISCSLSLFHSVSLTLTLSLSLSLSLLLQYLLYTSLSLYSSTKAPPILLHFLLPSLPPFLLFVSHLQGIDEGNSHSPRTLHRKNTRKP